MSAGLYRRAMAERELQQAVKDAAHMLGWLGYHTHDSRRSDAGFPDLVLLRPKDGRRLVLEFKTAKGRVRPEQQTWLQAFSLCGIPAMIVRPDDLDFVLELLK